MTTYAYNKRITFKRQIGEISLGFGVASVTINTGASPLADAASSLGNCQALAFTLDADRVMSNLPHMPLTFAQHRICLINEDSTFKLTLKDDNVLSGSKMLLQSFTLTLGPGHRIWFRVNDAGTFWVQETYPFGNCAPMSISAHAGGGQALATAITEPLTIVSTVASAGDSVLIQEAGSVKGHEYRVFNAGAYPMDVFPKAGDSFNNLAANTAISLAPGTGAKFIGTDANLYRTIGF